MATKFYLCEKCGNIIGVIHNSGVPMMCCGEKMKLIEANVVDASYEKHIPEVKWDGDVLKATVGSVLHPMTPEHHISWIYVESKDGGQRKNCTDIPEAEFRFANDEPVAVYAYCNLHGLWVKEL